MNVICDEGKYFLLLLPKQTQFIGIVYKTRFSEFAHYSFCRTRNWEQIYRTSFFTIPL
jgi:hypothetical protein